MNELKKRKILLVDDEVLIAINTKSQLEELGYNVALASNSDAAIQMTMEDDAIALILMDIDLGRGVNGIDTSLKILAEKDIPIIFISSHTEPEIIASTENVTSYGYVVKSTNIIAYDISIKMAYKLFLAKRKTETFRKYIETALENASEPIFISDCKGEVIYFNKAFLEIQNAPKEEEILGELSKYENLIVVFSDTGEKLNSDDWASTRPLHGKSGDNVIFYVYNSNIDKILVNYYTYAPIFDNQRNIIGSYVKIGEEISNPDTQIIEKIKKELARIMKDLK